MKEQILKYINDNPKLGYYHISKKFNTPLKELFNLLDISKYKIGDTYLHIYDVNNNNNKIYKEDSKGYWEKCEYGENNNLIFKKNSKGFYYKWE